MVIYESPYLREGNQLSKRVERAVFRVRGITPAHTVHEGKLKQAIAFTCGRAKKQKRVREGKIGAYCSPKVEIQPKIGKCHSFRTFPACELLG